MTQATSPPEPNAATARQRLVGLVGLVERPWLVALAATVVGFPVNALASNSVAPRSGLDPSWMLGLSLAQSHGLRAGRQLAFTYGPLGFLSVPLGLSRLQLAAGLVFGAVMAFAFFAALVRCADRLAGPWVAAVVALAFAFIAPMLPTAELGGLALVLWVLWLLARELDGQATPLAVLAVLGAACSVLVLVKFSLGALAVTVAALALAGPGRLPLRRVAVAAGSAIVALPLLWFAAGQHLGDLGPWLRRSVDLALGYGSAMSAGDLSSEPVALVLVPLLLGVLAGLVLLVRASGSRAIPTVVVVGLCAWLFLKESVVRFDPTHYPVVAIVAAALVVALPWPRRIAAVVVALAVGLALPLVGVRNMVTARSDAAHGALVAAREVLDGGYHQAQIRAATAVIRTDVPIDPKVVAALRGHHVHADPWYVASVYAAGLDWRPSLVLQSYVGYTSGLDADTARSLTSADGPDAILARTTGELGFRSIDERFPLWESPATQLATTCNFRIAATSAPWQALVRSTDVCGRRTRLATLHTEAGRSIDVPRPTRPGDVVVARIDASPSAIDRAATFLLRPPHAVRVLVDGRSASFVITTAGDDHLIRVPAASAGDGAVRPLPGAGLDIETLRFEGVSGPVVVEFDEISIG